MSEAIRKLYEKANRDPAPYPLNTPGARSKTSVMMDQVIEECALVAERWPSYSYDCERIAAAIRKLKTAS